MIKLNGFEIKPTMFPDKTSQVWKLPVELFHSSSPTIEWVFESESEFMHLAQLKALIDGHVSMSDEGLLPVTLILPYLPYARQDKMVSNTSTFALIPFAKLLNSLGFHEVLIVDPHSEIAINLIDRSRAVYPKTQLALCFVATKVEVVAFPDSGALSKYSKTYSTLFEEYYRWGQVKVGFIHGSKIRNQLTGNIEGYKIEGDSPKGKNVLIVDDLCDGGATFIALSKELIEGGAKTVDLFVTHGLFTKGLDVLREAGIARVFTKDGLVSDWT